MESVRNLTQAYSQAPWRKQVMFIGLFLLVVVFIALVAGIYLDVSARAATIGREIQFMQLEIEKNTLENADLETQLAILNSAAEMEKRALALGFEPIEMGQETYVIVPGYIPRQQPKLAPPPEPVKTYAAAAPSAFSQSLFDWLQKNALPAASRLLEVNP
jgi:cell division protein FtsL